MPFITQDPVVGTRNRIINGGMRIDQRNVGTAQVTNNGTYLVDRFMASGNLNNPGTFQQQTSNPPPGHTHYLNWTNNATVTSQTTAFQAVRHVIEGNNIGDLRWGSSAPLPITLSFMNYVSTAGNYSVAIRNAASNYSYTISYLVSQNNTWTTIRLVIPGPPIGSVWATDTGFGLDVFWNLHGSGNTLSSPTTTGSWANANYIATSNQINLGAIANSYWNLTAIQLEVGTVATPFEWRPYETEMRLCQRYFEKSYDYGTAIGTAVNNGVYFGTAWSTGGLTGFAFRVEKRTIPNVTTYAGNTPNSVSAATSGASTTTINYQVTSTKTMPYFGVPSGTSLTQSAVYFWHWTASADF